MPERRAEPQLRSLQLQTDLNMLMHESEIQSRAEYIVVRTPSNPGFWWGNFLIFPDPPREGDLDRWLATFAREVGAPPQLGHVALTWDGTDGADGAVDEFLKAEFERESTTALTATSVRAPRTVNRDCALRAFADDGDWRRWIELALVQHLVESPDHDAGDTHRDFIERHARSLRRAVDLGHGQWFGAFVDDRLVGSMGLFVHRGLGRFQWVDTHPEFRRQGIASTLLHHVASVGLNTMGATTLVIVADDASFTPTLYRSLGFVATERTIKLSRATPAGAATRSSPARTSE